MYHKLMFSLVIELKLPGLSVRYILLALSPISQDVGMRIICYGKIEKEKLTESTEVRKFC